MVIKKKCDNNWEYCIYIGKDENGKKKYKRKCGFKTKKECLEEANKIEEKKLIIKNNTKTFKNVCYLVLEDCVKRGVRENTLVTYRSHVKFLIKNFEQANKDIKKIKPNDVYNFINTKTNLYKNAYTRKIIDFLKYIFSYAEKMNLISNNIFDEIQLPKKINVTRDIWSEQEINTYLPILKQFKYYDILYLVLETGMRRGEVCALTWDCIDFVKNVIKVEKAYIVNGSFSGITPPKTKSSVRQIILLEESVRILKRLYKNKTSKYVFPNPNDLSKPINPRVLSSNFNRFLKRYNIKNIRFHDLRHIHATLLLNKNINYKILSKRLGHSNISFTLQTYTHVIPEHELKLFKDLAKIF